MKTFEYIRGGEEEIDNIRKAGGTSQGKLGGGADRDRCSKRIGFLTENPASRPKRGGGSTQAHLEGFPSLSGESVHSTRKNLENTLPWGKKGGSPRKKEGKRSSTIKRGRKKRGGKRVPVREKGVFTFTKERGTTKAEGLLRRREETAAEKTRYLGKEANAERGALETNLTSHGGVKKKSRAVVGEKKHITGKKSSSKQGEKEASSAGARVGKR